MWKNKLNKIWNLIEILKNDINMPIISDFLEWFYEKIELNFTRKNPISKINKWDIFFVKLWKNIWSELNKNRPCLVITDYFYNSWNTIVIIPLKSYKWKQNKNTQVLLKFNLLKSSSLVDILSIRQIDKKRLNNYVWHISFNDLTKIERKISKIFWIKNKE